MATFEDTYRVDTESSLGGIKGIIGALKDQAEALEDVGDTADDLEGSTGKAEGGFWNLSKAIKAVVAVAAGMAILSTAKGIIDNTVGAFTEWDTALNHFQAQTGATNDELAEYRDIAQDIYTSNWGDSIEDVVATMAQVKNITGESGDELDDLTTSALIFRDTFDADITESVRAVDTMIENFGIDGERAFDIMTTAMQKTGDPGQDLLDTFNEYSANFADMGFTAEQFFSMMATGLEAGARNSDDLADGMREFQIRLKDGTSQAAIYSLGLAGINYEYQRGEASGKEMFVAVRNALLDIEDPIQRNALGVQLFGTKWEDAGEDALLSMSLMTDGMGDIEGATDRAGESLSKGLGPAWQSFVRTIQTGLVNAITPLAVSLLSTLIPILEALGGWLTTTGIPALMDFGSEVAEGAGKVLDFGSKILDALGGKEAVFGTIRDVAGEVATALGDVIDMMGSLSPESAVLLGVALAAMAAPSIVSGIGGLVSVLGGIGPAIRGIWASAGPLILIFGIIAAYESNFGGLADKVRSVREAFEEGDLKGVVKGVADSMLAIPLGLATEFGNLVGIDVPGGLSAWEGTFDNLKIILGKLPDLVSGLIEAVTGFTPGEMWDKFKTTVQSIKNVFGVMVNTVVDFVTSIASFSPSEAWEAFKATVQAVKNIFSTVAIKASAFVDKVMGFAPGTTWELLKTVLQGIRDALSSVAISAGLFITDLLSFVVPDDITLLQTTWEAIKSALEPLGEFLKNIFGKLGEFVVSGDLTLLQSIWETIKGALDGLAGLVESFIDALGRIKVPDALTEAANLFNSIKDTGDSVIDSLWPDELAKGGRVAPSTPYIVGERGPELFVPDVAGVIKSTRDTLAMMRNTGGTPFSSFNSTPVFSAQGAGGGGASWGGGYAFNGPVNINGVNNPAQLFKMLEEYTRRKNLSFAKRG